MIEIEESYLPTHWCEFENEVSQAETAETQFVQALKQNWDELHKLPDVFRYKINNIDERILDKHYLLQLNPERGSNRRYPEEISNICQPFDPDKFNFTKVPEKEILFQLHQGGEKHFILVNVSPISRYHSLMCPSVDKCLPQVVTAESLKLAVNIMFLSQDRDMRIGFNSLCALASVNHLHYHIFLDKNTLPVENVKTQHITKSIYCFDKAYPVPAFCLRIKSKTDIQHTVEETFKMIQYLLKKNIAHNIMITRGKDLCIDGNGHEDPGTSDIDLGQGVEDYRNEVMRIVVWPRKSSFGVKQLSAFNVAVCELSGWFPVFNADDFKKLQTSDVEKEIRKWELDNFEELCEELKQIF